MKISFEINGPDDAKRATIVLGKLTGEPVQQQPVQQPPVQQPPVQQPPVQQPPVQQPPVQQPPMHPVEQRLAAQAGMAGTPTVIPPNATKADYVTWIQGKINSGAFNNENINAQMRALSAELGGIPLSNPPDGYDVNGLWRRVAAILGLQV